MADVMAKLAAQDDRRDAMIGAVELLLDRLHYLEPEDRTLLEMRFRHGLTYGQLMLLTGQDRKVIGTRVRGLARRLMAGDYIVIVRQRDRFDEQERAVAYDHFLLGMGYRRIAEKRGLGTHRVRQILKRVQRWLSRYKQGQTN